MFDYRPARTGELAGRIFEETRTDSQGRYRLPVPPTVEGILSFWVEDGLGWRILWSTNFLDPEIDGTVFDLAARLRDQDIRLRIVDTERRPIRGAEVRLVIRGEGGPVPGLAPLKTGPDGTVATGAIELGGYWADASAPGYATARMCPYQFDVGDKSFVDVVLEKSIRIRGQVVGEHGRTPADLHVAVGYVCKPKMGWYRWFVSVTEDGHFVADVPEGEAFQIQWTASGHEGHSKSQKATRSPDGRVVCRDFD